MKKGFLLGNASRKKKTKATTTRKESTTINNSGPITTSTTTSTTSTSGGIITPHRQHDDDDNEVVVGKDALGHKGNDSIESTTNFGKKKKSTRCSSLLLFEENSTAGADDGEEDGSTKRRRAKNDNSNHRHHRNESSSSSILNILIPPQQQQQNESSRRCESNILLLPPLLNSHGDTNGMNQGILIDHDDRDKVAGHDSTSSFWIKECSTKWKNRQLYGNDYDDNDNEANYNLTKIERCSSSSSSSSRIKQRTQLQDKEEEEEEESKQNPTPGNHLIVQQSPMVMVGKIDRSAEKMVRMTSAIVLESLPTDLSKVMAQMKQQQQQQQQQQRQGKSKNKVVQVSQNVLVQEFFLRYKILQQEQEKGGNRDMDMDTDKGDKGREDMITRRHAIHFIWDTILEGLSLYVKDTNKIFGSSTREFLSGATISSSSFCRCLIKEESPPVFVIGHGLLETCPRISCLELLGICLDSIRGGKSSKEDDDNVSKQEEGCGKRQKIKRLGAMLIIRYYILEMYTLLWKWMQTDHPKDCLEEQQQEDRVKLVGSIDVILLLLEHGPLLFASNLEDKDGMIRRSVLAVNVMDTYFWLLEYSSLMYQVSLSSETLLDGLVVQSIKELPKNLWYNLSVLEKMLETLKGWNAASYGKGCSGNDTTTAAVSSISCAEALLKDWTLVVGQVRETYDKRRFLDMANEEDACLESVETFTKELAGIHLQRNGGKTVGSYGGIAQTLCKQWALSNSDCLNRLQVGLEAAKSCIFQQQQEEASLSRWEVTLGDDLTMIVRQLCGLLSRKKGLVGRMDSDIRTKAVESCLMLMRSKSGRCINLLESVLNAFWSMEDSLPSDFRKLDEIPSTSPIPEDKVPQSFNILAEHIRSYNDDDDNEGDGSCQVILTSLLERFLLRKPTLLIAYYLSKVKCNALECNVLVDILVNRKKHKQLTVEQCVSIEQHLFQRIDHNKHLQRLIHSKSNIFQSLPLKILIDKLWVILSQRDPSDLATSAASALMMDILEQKASREGDVIVSILLGCLSKSHPRAENCSKEPQRLAKSMKFIEKWSKSLVTSDRCGDDSFASILVACGREMFQDPSNSLILTLFGTMMDGSMCACSSSKNGDKSRKRVVMAVIRLVHLCILKIEEYDGLDACSDESNLFHRLSPLLLLRRMSHIQFGIASSTSEEGRKEMMHLARVLAKSLGLSTQHSNPHMAPKEERRLSADIAAVCLPFSITEKYQCDNFSSVFLVFCEDSLFATVSQLKNEAISSIDFKRVKVALYIACRAVQIAPETVGRNELHFLSKFVLLVLNIHSNLLSDDIVELVVELQTCCIEFLSTCICRIYNLPQDHHRREFQGNLIEEISTDGDAVHQELSPSTVGSIYQDLCNFQSDILTLISGYHDLRQRDLAEISLSTSARICLLNAVTISCRICSSEALPKLSKIVAPNILAWLTSGDIGDEIRHPLCVASAMQSILNCLHRSKSFDCLETCIKERKDTAVRKLFRLCLDCVQSRGQKHTNCSEQNTMRLTSLKLLVLTITLSQSLESSNDSVGYLYPSDISQCFSVLNGLANIDENEEVRTLASQLAAIVYAR